MSIEFENKYVVAKRDDIEKYLDIEGQRALHQCLNVISEGRGRDGKMRNTYLVLNTDEPYAAQVAQIMKNHGHYTPGGQITVSIPEIDRDRIICMCTDCQGCFPDEFYKFCPWCGCELIYDDDE